MTGILRYLGWPVMNKHTLISGVVLLSSISCFCGSSYGSSQSQERQELEIPEVAKQEIRRLRREIEELRREVQGLREERQEWLQRRLQKYQRRVEELKNEERVFPNELTVDRVVNIARKYQGLENKEKRLEQLRRGGLEADQELIEFWQQLSREGQDLDNETKKIVEKLKIVEELSLETKKWWEEVQSIGQEMLEYLQKQLASHQDIEKCSEQLQGDIISQGLERIHDIGQGFEQISQMLSKQIPDQVQNPEFQQKRKELGQKIEQIN